MENSIINERANNLDKQTGETHGTTKHANKDTNRINKKDMFSSKHQTTQTVRSFLLFLALFGKNLALFSQTFATPLACFCDPLRCLKTLFVRTEGRRNVFAVFHVFSAPFDKNGRAPNIVNAIYRNRSEQGAGAG